MKTTAIGSNPSHIQFWNRIRYLVVLCVVLHHGACAYSKLVPWWYVNSGQSTSLFDLVVSIFDLFIMPVLFFVSGYFALPSLRRRGPGGFLRGKIRRLLLPMVFLTVFYVPIINYISSIAWGRNTTFSFFAYWQHVVSSVTLVCWRVLDSVESSLPYIDDMTPNYLWYLTLLFLTMLLFLALEMLGGRSGEKGSAHEPQSGRRMLGVVAVFGVAISLAMIGICLYLPIHTWVQASSFLVFQPIRAPLYVGMFFLGVYACRHGWFVRRALPGPLWMWILGLVVSELILVVGHGVRISWPVGYTVIWAAGRTAFALCMTALLTTLGFRYWERETRLHTLLAKSSYDLYLLHLPLLVALQYGLRTADMSIYLKYALGVGLTIVLCVGASLAARKQPQWIKAGGMLVVFALVCLLA